MGKVWRATLLSLALGVTVAICRNSAPTVVCDIAANLLLLTEEPGLILLSLVFSSGRSSVPSESIPGSTRVLSTVARTVPECYGLERAPLAAPTCYRSPGYNRVAFRYTCCSLR